jgi:hypothetical protein
MEFFEWLRGKGGFEKEASFKAALHKPKTNSRKMSAKVGGF